MRPAATITMLQRLQNHLASYVEHKDLKAHWDIHAHLFCLVALIYCTAIHFVLLIFNLLVGSASFVWANLASLVVYTVLSFLHRRKKYTQVAIILTVEVCLYATLSVLLVGTDTYVVLYFLLAAVLQIVFPYHSPRLRRGMLAASILLCLAVVCYSFMIEPIVSYGQGYVNTLIFINMLVLFFGILSLLYFSNMVSALMRHLEVGKLQELTDLANTDPLTGLYNRRYAEIFFPAIDKKREEPPYCLVMLDIDHFKLVNDEYGHAAGDEVLIYLAEFLRLNLRKNDVIFRWGGEEFLIVLENVDLETGHTVMDMLRARLEKTPIRAGGRTLRITFTAGVSILDKEDFSGSLAQADKNLYTGKAVSRNVIISA